MFENYSLADLWANLIKNKKQNLIAMVILFLVIAIPVSYRAINSQSVIRNDSSYSNYLMFKIDAPEKANQVDITSSTLNNQYSNFFTRMIIGSLNGAYLFNDVTDKDVSEYAAESSSNVTQLRNSDYDFWEKKVTVSSLGDSTGFSVKILTTSQKLNQLIDIKISTLIDQYKNTFSGVTITKLDTISSQEASGSSQSTVSNFNLRQLVIRLLLVAVTAIFLVTTVNLALYLFNPTLNRAGDFKKYGISHVFEVRSMAMLVELISYQTELHDELVVVTSNPKLIKKLQNASITVIEMNNYDSLRHSSNYLFVEEYGASRYGQFERKLQELQNFDKTIVGVAALPL